jgi:hypothetical protein
MCPNLCCPQESLDREQLKLGQHLRQEIKARKATEKSLSGSLASAAAAAAADVAKLAGRTDTGFARLRDVCAGLAEQQKQGQKQQTLVADNCSALQKVGALCTVPWNRFQLASARTKTCLVDKAQAMVFLAHTPSVAPSGCLQGCRARLC